MMRLLMRWTNCTRKIVLFGGFALLAGAWKQEARSLGKFGGQNKQNVVFRSSERMSRCWCFSIPTPFPFLTLRSYLWRARLQTNMTRVYTRQRAIGGCLAIGG